MRNSNSSPSHTRDREDPAAWRLDDVGKSDRSLATLAETPDPLLGIGLANVPEWASLPTRWYDSTRDWVSPYLRQPLRAYTDVAQDRPGSGIPGNGAGTRFPGEPKSSDTARDIEP